MTAVLEIVVYNIRKEYSSQIINKQQICKENEGQTKCHLKFMYVFQLRKMTNCFANIGSPKCLLFIL